MRKIVQLGMFILGFNLVAQETVQEEIAQEDRVVCSFRSSDGVIIPVYGSIAEKMRAFKDTLDVEKSDQSQQEPFELPMVSKKSWELIYSLFLECRHEENPQKIEKKCTKRINTILSKKSDKVGFLGDALKAIDFLEPTFYLQNQEKDRFIYTVVLKEIKDRLLLLKPTKGLETLETIGSQSWPLVVDLQNLFVKELINGEKFIETTNLDPLPEPVLFPIVSEAQISYNNDGTHYIKYFKRDPHLELYDNNHTKICTFNFPDQSDLKLVFFTSNKTFLYIENIESKTRVLACLISPDNNNCLVIGEKENPGKVTCSAVSESRKSCAIGFNEKQGVRVLNRIAGTNRHQSYIIPDTSFEGILAVAYNKQGTILAIGKPGNKLALWDVMNGTLLKELNVKSGVDVLVFDEHDKYLAAAGGKRQGHLYFWNIKQSDNGEVITNSCGQFELKDKKLVKKIEFKEKCAAVTLYFSHEVKNFLLPNSVKIQKSVLMETVSPVDVLSYVYSKNKTGLKKHLHFYSANNGESYSARISDLKNSKMAHQGVQQLEADEVVEEAQEEDDDRPEKRTHLQAFEELDEDDQDYDPKRDQ